MFKKIADEKLSAYVVWEPILRTDDVRGARRATTILPDARVRHYWIDGQQAARLFQPVLGLRDELAWDVYLVYPAGVVWTGNRPPKPSYYMHQLHELPGDRFLNAATLAAQIRAATKSTK